MQVGIDICVLKYNFAYVILWASETYWASCCLSLVCLSLLGLYSLLVWIFFQSNSHLSVCLHLLGHHSVFFFDWWSVSLLLYWSPNLWFSSLLPTALQTFFLHLARRPIFYLSEMFCPTKPHYFLQYDCISFCLIVFFPSYNIVSLTLTAGCLQLLSCFNFDKLQV